MNEVIINNLMDELNRQLTSQEMEMVKALLKQYKGREVALLEDLLGYTYNEFPVDMSTFITSVNYLNLKGQIYPKIEEDLCELFDSKKYDEAVLTGGIGWGKSTFAEIALIRMVYEVSCFRNPQKAYGLAEGTKISFINCSTTMKQAQDVVFHGVKEKIRNSHYFTQKFKFLDILSQSLIFPNNIEIFPTVDPIGLNVFGGVLDEVNFMQVIDKSKMARGGKYDQAQTLHDNLIRRMKSRFMQNGKLPGILLNISSSRYPDDFTERLIAKAKEDPSIFVRRYAQWDTKPKSFYIGEYFYVSLGNGGSKKPEILKDDVISTAKQKKEKLEAEGIEVIEVPIEYLRDFETDIDGSIRDLAGRPTLTIKPFIMQSEKIFDAYARGEASGLKHPFNGLTTNLRDGVKIIPKLLPKPSQAPRFMHIDLALTGDSCGICMGHVKKYVKVLRRNENGDEYTEDLPYISIDLLLKVVPPNKGEIEIADVRSLIYELRSYGFNIQVVTFDQFQSADSIQQLKRRGIDAGHLSVDTSVLPYTTLKDALYEDRIEMYEYSPLTEELIRLEKDEAKNKVDHPADGSKDVADALAGVCYHCVTRKPMILSAPVVGGFIEDSLEDSDDIVIPIITD